MKRLALVTALLLTITGCSATFRLPGRTVTNDGTSHWTTTTTVNGRVTKRLEVWRETLLGRKLDD